MGSQSEKKKRKKMMHVLKQSGESSPFQQSQMFEYLNSLVLQVYESSDTVCWIFFPSQFFYITRVPKCTAVLLHNAVAEHSSEEK